MGKMEEGNKTFCHSYNTETTHFLLEIEAKKRQTKAAPISSIERAVQCLILQDQSRGAQNFTDIVKAFKVSSKFH